MSRTDPQMRLRLPADVKDFIIRQAHKNMSSQNSEIVRSIRERMDREAKCIRVVPHQSAHTPP